MKNIVKNNYGYFSVAELPTQKELEEYYETKYYQEAKGSYEIEYTAEEILHFKNQIAERAAIIEKHMDTKSYIPSFLDVGCGEGWALNFFKDKGWDVTGLDYSDYGCKQFNPSCIPNLIAGDVYKNLVSFIEQETKFDVVYVDNVLEHVIDPEQLVNWFKKIIKPSGILIIDVPNDYSLIQNYLLDKGHVSNKYWIIVPDHLSYFNKEGLVNLLETNGWDTITCIGDYPIDWNLLNPNTNYIEDKIKGKSCHKERVEFENLINTQPLDKVINFHTALADLGLGRTILGFFKLKN
jgi:2-polyprenyl-3-methyl-5-hydroxy-6-metoxy-1,4-benzoquinol methylase